MLVSKPIQIIVNLVVILFLVVLVMGGLFMLLPVKGPMGTIVGKVGNLRPTLLAGILSGLDPVELVRALNENPEFLSEMLSELSNPGNAQATARAINDNPDAIVVIMRSLNPEYLAMAINASGDLVAELLPLLDPAALADIVNQTGDFLTTVLPELNPDTVASLLKQSSPFIISLVSYLDPVAMVGVMNSVMAANVPWITSLISQLDPAVTASIVNLNVPFFSKVLSLVDIGPITSSISSNPNLPGLVSGVMAYLDPAAIGDLVNSSGDFLAALLAEVDPGPLVDVINDSSSLVVGVMDNLDPRMAGELTSVMASDQAMIARLLGLINPAPIAGALTANVGFLKTFMKETMNYLDLGALTASLSGSSDAIVRLLPYIRKDYITYLLKDNQFIDDVISGIDWGILAGVVNGVDLTSSGFLSSMLANLPPSLGRAAAEGINQAPALLEAFIADSNPEFLASLMSGAGSLLSKVIPGLDPALSAAVAQGVNRNPALIDAALASMDVPTILSIMGQVGPFAEEVSAHISPTVGVAAALGINANPALVSALAKNVDPGVLIPVLARHPEVIRQLLANLDSRMVPGLARAINSEATVNMLSGALPYLDPLVLSRVLDVNPGLIKDLMVGLDGNLGGPLARALSTNPGLVVQIAANMGSGAARAMAEGAAENPALMEQLIANLTPKLAKTLTQSLGSIPEGLMAEAVGNMNATTGANMARQVNSAAATNPGFIKTLVQSLTPSTAKILSDGLNLGAATGQRDFVTSLIANINADTGRAVSEGLNALGADGASSAVYALIKGIGPDIVVAVAQSISANPALLDGVVKALNIPGLIGAVNQGLAGSSFLPDTLANTDVGMINGIINNGGLDLVKKLLGYNPSGSNPGTPPLIDAKSVADALAGGGLIPMGLFQNVLAYRNPDGSTLGKSIAGMLKSDTALDMLSDMMSSNPEAAYPVAASLQASLLSGNSLLRHMGLGARAVVRIPILNIVVDITAYGYVINVWAGSFPFAPPGWPIGT